MLKVLTWTKHENHSTKMKNTSGKSIRGETVVDRRDKTDLFSFYA